MKSHRSHSHHRPTESLEASWTRKDIHQVAEGLAYLLDSSFTIPGTKMTMGLDPLLGLIPGIGDLISNAIGSTLLFLATKAGVPRIVILRMSVNIVLNMIIGAIPVLGDLFSIWFKSNVRNAQLLHRHCHPTTRRATYGDWLYVCGVIIGMILLIVFILGALVWLGMALLATLGVIES